MMGTKRYGTALLPITRNSKSFAFASRHSLYRKRRNLNFSFLIAFGRLFMLGQSDDSAGKTTLFLVKMQGDREKHTAVISHRHV